MLKSSFIILMICMVHSAMAQGIISGKLVDSQSRQPLEAAFISIANGGRKAISDHHGNFNVSTQTAQAHILISCLGYKNRMIEAVANQELVIALEPTEIILSAVTLEATRSAGFSNIAKIDLALKPVRNTQELLRIVPGIFIAQHAGGGKAEQIFMRGFDSDHGTDVLVTVDDMPVNMVSHAHGQGYADAHFIIPETIKNIDFGAGPYNTQQGNLSTAGYINFSTFKTLDKSLVQVEGGRFDTYRALALIDLLPKKDHRQSAYMATEYYFTNGPTINPQNFKRFNGFGKYNLALSERLNMTATLSSFSSKWSASGQIPQRAVESGLITRFGSVDPTEGGHTERHNARLNFVHAFGKGSTWEHNAYYTRYLFNLYSNFTFYLNDALRGDQIKQAEKRNLFGYTSKLSKNASLFGSSLNSLYAVGVRHDDTKNSQLARAEKRRFIEDAKLGDIKEWNSFAFVEQQLIRGRWLVNAGLRLDYLHFEYIDKLASPQLPAQGKRIWSPKINIQYTLNQSIQLYSKAGKGFHSNDTRVVVAQGGQQILPAAYGVDFGVNLKAMDNLFINAAAWYLHSNQEFVYVGDEGIVEPSGSSRRTGIDVMMRYQISKPLFATFNMNFARPRALGEAKGADYIPLAPSVTSLGGLYYRKTKGLNGGITYRYIKSRPANEDNSISAKGYFLCDGSLNYTHRKYELGVAVENIFDIEWNEAQFATESRLANEPAPVTELHYTPGSPLFAKFKVAIFF